MDERQAGSAGAAAAFIALITLLTVAALLAPRFSAPIVEPQAAPVAEPAVPSVEMWLSTADRRLRLEPQPDIVMDVGDASPADIVIDIKKTYQTMDGFGAAMTDSSAWLLQHKLNALQRSALLQELYGPPPNLDFNMMRLTIGASDFSLKPYTLDDVPSGQTDETLEHFNVTSNLQDVIPVVREVLTIDPGMLIMATPWSAPAWMKTSQNLIGGELLPQYEDNYADYLVKYLDAMRGNGIPIFALTLQNEPGFVPITYPGMQMPSDTRARVIGQFLGPRLAARQPATRILEWDHNWSQPEQPMSVLADPVATRYISGVAWHCYEGNPFNQGRVHHAFPQKDVYLTECSGGDWASAAKGELIWFARDLLVTGIRQTDRKLIEVGAVFGLDRAALVRRIILPSSVPYLLVGLRIGLGQSWLFLVAAELIASTRGLGYLLIDGQSTARPNVMLVGILVLAGLGKLSDSGVRAIERRALHWADAFEGR